MLTTHKVKVRSHGNVLFWDTLAKVAPVLSAVVINTGTRSPHLIPVSNSQGTTNPTFTNPVTTIPRSTCTASTSSASTTCLQIQC